MYKRAFPCRCRQCRHRVSLAMKPEHYEIEPKCKKCEGQLAIDTHRLKREHQKYNCQCHGYGFQHRIKSKWCIYGSFEPDSDEIERHYGSSDKPPF